MGDFVERRVDQGGACWMGERMGNGDVGFVRLMMMAWAWAWASAMLMLMLMYVYGHHRRLHGEKRLCWYSLEVMQWQMNYTWRLWS